MLYDHSFELGKSSVRISDSAIIPTDQVFLLGP
jgi:hypothetical protein